MGAMFVLTPADSGVGSVSEEPAVDGVDPVLVAGWPAGAVDGAVVLGAVDVDGAVVPGAPAFCAIDGLANAATASMAAIVGFEILAEC